MGSLKLFLNSFLIIFIITSCSQSDPNLFSLKNSGNGPDEFSLITLREIQMPADFLTLPKPSLNGSNLADQNPQEDIILALGGSLPVKTAETLNDDMLLEDAAARFGIIENIRDELSLEDKKFRIENRGLVLERLVSLNVYFRAYSSMALDSKKELERLSGLGIKILAKPPEKTK